MSDLTACFIAGAATGAGCALAAAVAVIHPYVRRWQREREMAAWWHRRASRWLDRKQFRG